MEGRGKGPKSMTKPGPALVTPTAFLGRYRSFVSDRQCAMIQLPGTRPATCFRLRKGFAMPDVVEFKPVRARRPHRAVRPKLLNIKGLDWRTAARKAFAALVAEIEHDLGGREQLSAIEKSLIQAYAGSAILLDDLNARVVLARRSTSARMHK